MASIVVVFGSLMGLVAVFSVVLLAYFDAGLST